ncbi:MAG: hypothetical protein AAFU85_24850 [Planctomycetota bacterium]
MSNTDQSEIHRSHFPTILACVIFGVASALWSVVLLSDPGSTPGGSVLRWLLPLVAAGLLLGAWLATKQSTLTLKMSDEGLWIQKHKLLLPWDEIESVEAIVPHQRRGDLAKAAHAVATGRQTKARFLAIRLTEGGREKLGGRDFVGSSTRKQLKIHEDVLIPPRRLPLGKLDEIAETIRATGNIPEATGEQWGSTESNMRNWKGLSS